MLRATLPALLLIAAMPVSAQPHPDAKTFGDRLAKLDEFRRFAVLRRAVIDGGQSCKRVTAAIRQQPYKNFDMWSVRCAPAGDYDYGVFIAFDSSVQIRPCRDLARLGLPLCRLPKRK